MMLTLVLFLQIKHLRKNADDEPTEEQSAAERETAEETCRILKELGPEAGKVLISSFSVEALEVCQAQLPSIPRSLLVEAVPQDWYEQVERLKCVSLNFNSKKVTQMTVETIAATGTPMYSYTVNDGDRAIELLNWGVDGVFSDCPDIIEEAILRAALPSSSPGAE